MRAAARLEQAGALGLDGVDSSSSSESGNESEAKKSRKSRRKVKSGAKVKQRSVIRTELWPHTIVNERDGEVTTSEDISQAKFNSGFTYIMATCEEKEESSGRAVLLHALSTMLEYLPWPEVRTFHNLVMVKLEQGRFGWSADFAAESEQYLDQKVRQTLRSRLQPTGYRGGVRRSGRGNYNPNYRGNEGQSRFAYNHLCRQWNAGNCTYGPRCRKWHVCRACGEAGKMGEPHPASSADCPNSRGRRSDQRS